MSPRVDWVIPALLAACVIGVSAGPVGAVTQLTSAELPCSYLSPQLSSSGQWVVAVSLCHTKLQTQEHQIIRLDRPTGNRQTLTPPGFQSVSPSVSGDGQRIAFVSNADLVSGQNPHRLEQVFLFDAITNRYAQLTRIGPADPNRAVNDPRVSGNGNTVVFASNADLVSGQNKDGNLELFLYDVQSGALQQVTQTEFPARHQRPLVSDDGQTVAFIGIHPPFNTRPTTGVYEWNRRTDRVQRLIDTPYSDAGAFTELVMAGRGHRLVFSGRYDLIGENPDRNIELFIFDPASRIARQVTHTMGCTSAHPALSADGLRLLFVSNCRFGKLNPALGPNLFMMRLDTGEIVQVTEIETSAAIEPPAMDRSGRLLAVSVGAELTGMANPNRLLQIVILTLPPVEPMDEPRVRMVTAHEMRGVLASRHDPDTLFLFTRGLGIMKSQDGGRFWKLASLGLGTTTVTSLIEHRDQAGLLFAGTWNAGVYKSMDGGGLWVSSNSGLGDPRVLDLAIDPVLPDVIYAGTPTGLYWSRDRGDTWELLSDRVTLGWNHQGTSGDGLSEGSSRSVATKTLAPAWGNAGRLLGLSEVGLFALRWPEREWVQVATPRLPQWVAVSPKRTTWFIGTGEGIYRSDRADGNWAAVSGLPPGPIPSISFGPEGTEYAATREGLYESRDRGLTWIRAADIKGVVQLMPDVSPTATLFAALDNGDLMVSRDGGHHWEPLKIPAPSSDGLQSVLSKPVQ